jgi:hypothetical protein
MSIVHGFSELHPLRLILRALLRAGELAPEQLAFVRECALSQSPMQRTIETRNRDFSDFDDLFAELHGTFRLQLRAAVPQESLLLYNGRAIVTLAWLAPWAISVMKLADYYELDCSFKALKP